MRPMTSVGFMSLALVGADLIIVFPYWRVRVSPVIDVLQLDQIAPASCSLIGVHHPSRPSVSQQICRRRKQLDILPGQTKPLYENLSIGIMLSRQGVTAQTQIMNLLPDFN